MTARVSFVVGQARAALLVPDQAIVPQGGRQVVYVVRDGMATATAVEVGERQGGEAEILSGLTANDTVVVSGQNKLPKPTQKIRPVPYAAESVAPVAGAQPAGER
jgi:membrane fusion protein (multidrug efflux system)